jgi:O-antigen/teichoic acid export membrane protein
LFQIISDFGLQNFNTRHVSRFPHLLEKYFPNLLVIKLLLSVVYFVVALGIAAVLGDYPPGALGLLSVLLVNQIMVQLILFLRSNIAGLGHYRTDSLLSSLDKFLMLIFCGAALWWHSANEDIVLWFVLAQMMALMVTLGTVWMVLISISKLPFNPYLLTNLKSGWPVIRLLFRKSLPFAIVILLMSAYTRMDSIILERMLPDGAYHTDVFAGGYRLLDALNMFGYLFASLLLPMFSRLLGEKKAVYPLASLSFKLIWVGSLTACVAIYLHRTDLITLMFPDKADIPYRAEVCGVLIWNFLAVCTTYIFSTLLTAGEQMKAMNRFFVAGLVLDLVLNFLLIPHYQAMGAAIASLSTQTFVSLGMIWLCIKIFAMRPSLNGVLRWGVFTGGLVAVAFLLIAPADWPWLYKFGAILLTGAAIGAATGNIADFRKVD